MKHYTTRFDNRFDKYRLHGFGVIGLAAAGTAISAGTSIYGAVAGGGSEGGGNEAAVAQAYADYNRRVSEWSKFWNRRIPSMTRTQRVMFRKTSEMLNKYKGEFAKSFREGSLERVHRQFVGEVNNLSQSLYTELRGDINSLDKGELDPKFAQRVTEAEHEINRVSADSLNDYVMRNARERAKGGMGFINPERRDEMVSGNWARSRDMARAQARSQVEETLSKMISQKGVAGQNLIVNKASLIDDYAGLGAAQRARAMGALQSNFGFDAQSLRDEAANRGFRDMLRQQRYMDRPQMAIPGIQPAQERSTGQQVMDIGGVVGGLLGNSDLNSLLSRWFNNNNNYQLTPRGGTGSPTPW